MKTEQQTKAKLLDRVRRLYAMANDSSSPNEAAIALRRVRSLMDAHQLTEADLQQSDFAKAGGEHFNRMPRWYSILSIGVAAFNDCVVSLEYADGAKHAQFKGFENDTVSALLMLDYLIDCMERGWREFDQTRDRSSNTTAAKNSFYVGFAGTMQAKLKELAAARKAEYMDASTGTALVVIKMNMVRREFGMQRITRARQRVSDGGGHHAGQATAARTNINRHVGGAAQRQLT